MWDRFSHKMHDKINANAVRPTPLPSTAIGFDALYMSLTLGFCTVEEYGVRGEFWLG